MRWWTRRAGCWKSRGRSGTQCGLLKQPSLLWSRRRALARGRLKISREEKKEGEGRRGRRRRRFSCSSRCLFDSLSSLRHVGIWTLFYEPFRSGFSCTVSWSCLVRQRIQSMRQFSEALGFSQIFHVFLDRTLRSIQLLSLLAKSGHVTTSLEEYLLFGR